MDLAKLSDAHVTYNDLIGTVAVDFDGENDDLENYAKNNGIDIEKFDPVGIELYGGHGDIISFVILCVERNLYPVSDGQKIPTTAFHIDQTFEDLLLNLKSIHILLLSKFQKISDIKIIKSIETDGSTKELGYK